MSQRRTNANTGGGSDGGESGGGSSSGGRDPIYRGVRQRKSSKKWVSEIREPKTPNRIWLGTFTTPEMAAVAYDVAALALKGKNAELNFPNSASSLPTPLSTSPRDIQAAAASAAAALGAAVDALGGGVAAENDRPVVVEEEEEEEANVGGGVVNNNNINNEEFVDEDMIFDMPNILLNMAHGMMISPPRMGGLDDAGDNVNVDDGGNLWNYYP